MYCDIAHGNWSQLPFVQRAHNTAYSSTIHETPHHLMLGRMSTLPIDIVMGTPQAKLPDTALQYTRETVENCSLHVN